MAVVPALNGASELLRVQFPNASQLYIKAPSLRYPMTVTFCPVAVAVPTLTLVEQTLASASAVLLPGQLIVGELPSAVTVTVKLQVSPVSAVAVTTVDPAGKKQSLQWSTVMLPHSSLPLGGEK